MHSTRPKTQKLSQQEKAAIAEARAALAQGESIKPIAFALTKDKAGYLSVHL